MKKTAKKTIDVRTYLTGQVSENTILLYEEAWKQYFKFAKSFEKAMDAATLVQFRQHLIASGYSAATVNTRLKGIKRIAKELCATKEIDKLTNVDIQDVAYLPDNALIERRRPNNKMHIEPEQMSKLCRAPKVAEDKPLELRDRALMFTLATTGCRLTETLMMKVHDIKQLPSDNYIVTGVLGKWQTEPRVVPLSAEAYNAIMDWIEFRPVASPYIFTGVTYSQHDGGILYHGEPMKRQTALTRIKIYAEEHGIPHLKAHDFRRFVATQVIKKNGIRSAQKVLGHADISTTAKYDTEAFLEGITEGLF